MAPDIKDEELIRSYLLGNVSEQEQEDLEERIMTDDEFSDLACVIESILVEEYLEGTLATEDRVRFEKLLLATPQGAEQLRFASALKEYASRRALPVETVKPHQRRPQSTFGSPWWSLAAAASLLIAAGIVVWLLFRPSPIAKGLAALAEAYPERPVVARVTGLRYAPRPPELRGGAGGKVNEDRLLYAESTLKTEARKHPGPESFHALGRLYIAKRDFQQAIEYLGKALEQKPDDATIHADLGAAYLELGKHNKSFDPGVRPREFDHSLEHLNRALDLDSDLIAPLFNRALLYEETLPEKAAAAWQEYLGKDRDSRWADEARNRLNKAIDNR
jgi:tetratricopeptide (TPR) repeat protein